MVHECYSTATYLKAYGPKIYPCKDRSMWQKVQGPNVLPPVYEKKLVGHPRTEVSNLMKSWASLVLKCPSMVLSLLAFIVEQMGITEVVASCGRLGSGLNYNLKTNQMWIMAKKEDQLKVLKNQLLVK